MRRSTGFRGPRVRRFDAMGLLALPLVVYFLLAAVVPLVLLLAASVRVDGRVSLSNYNTFVGDAYNRRIIWNTVIYGVAVTVGALGVGLPFALAVSRAGRRAQAVFLFAIVLSMTVSVIVEAFGWMVLFRSNGLINQMLMFVGAIGEPQPLLFSRVSLFLGTTSILLPFMVLPIYAVLRAVPEEVREAAATLGATPAYRFFYLVLPLCRSGILTGCAFVFCMTVSAYVIPSVLTGAGYPVMSELIVSAYLVTRDPALGGTASVLLILIAGSALVASLALAERTTFRV
jgi:putative spermidine/putrescine transport system permease protein